MIVDRLAGETTVDARPVVAHVNQLYFVSTQSYISFYLDALARYRPICLTRAPESAAIARHDSDPRLHIYGAARGVGQGNATLWSLGLASRRALTRLPPRVAAPLLDLLHRRIVPAVRTDSDAAAYVEWVVDVLRRERACLLHAYFAPLGWRLLEARRRLRIPLVVTFLGDDAAPSIGRWWWWLIGNPAAPPDWPARMRELFAEGDLFLVEGPYLRERLIGLGCPREKIEVQRMALPLARLEPRGPAENRVGAPLVVLFAGRFCEQKGLIYALEALRTLHDAGRAIEFRVIGDETLTHGHYASRVYAYIRRHRLGRWVRLLGFVNYDAYLRELRAADVFIHPSVVDAEGLSEGGAPTTILEAQALRVPVVSTWHCDIPNVTRPGESALLVPERDSAALAQAVLRLADDPPLRTRMGEAGRRWMEERHDVAREAVLLENRYSALLRRTISDGADRHDPIPAAPAQRS